jgi:hypothetical protein
MSYLSRFKQAFFHSIKEGESYKFGFNAKMGTRYNPEDILPLKNNLLSSDLGTFPIKPEGYPAKCICGFDDVKSGSIPIGTWWSIGFHTGRYLISFRWRSWDHPIFFIGKDYSWYGYTSFKRHLG